VPPSGKGKKAALEAGDLLDGVDFSLDDASGLSKGEVKIGGVPCRFGLEA